MSFTITDVTEYISNSDPVRKLYRLAMDKGFWPDFPDYKLEKLIGYLEIAKIENIGTIDDLIMKDFSVIQKFIAEVFTRRVNGRNWRLNSVFLCELVLILKYPQIFNREFLIENGWDEEIAEVVLGAVNASHSTSA